MKQLVVLVFLSLNIFTNLYAQEKTKPMHDTEIMRKVSKIDIEGREFENVRVTLKSISPDYFFSYTYRVKVTVKDNEGAVLWKRTLKNVYLYVFSDGQIQVGQPKFDKILIQKTQSGSFIAIIREKEGVY